MDRLTAIVEKHSTLIIIVTLVLTAFAGLRVTEIRYDDDVTTFLPEGDEDVARFWRIGDMFGGLNIAIVGLETTDESKDIFTSPSLAMLLELNEALRQVDGVRAVTSLATMRDAYEKRADDGEMQTVLHDMLPDVPTSPEALDALRRKTLTAPHVAGSVVSTDGRAMLLLCNLDDRQSPLDTAARIREEAEKHDTVAAGLRLHFGGAPFISEGLARASESDVLTLGPLVAIAIVLIVLVSFRSWRATLLSIVPVTLAIVLTIGFMAFLHEPLTLISSSLPIVLLALGSAYPVHVVSHALSVARERGQWEQETLREAMRRVGPPVLGAGLTTVFGFLSFLAMNISPMRSFGLFMALGIAISTALALFVVPAVLVRVRLPVRGNRKAVAAGMVSWLQRAVLTLKAHRVLVALVAAVVSVGGSVGVFFIHTDMSTSSYFTRETDTVRADRFLEERFGGSLYLQLLVEGDVRRPLVLDEIARLEDHARAIEGVTDVRSVTEVIRMANKCLFGVAALPRRPDQVDNLAKLADDDPAVHALVTRDWQHALIQIRLGGFDTETARGITDELGRYVREDMARELVAVRWRGDAAPEDLVRRVMERAAGSLGLVLYGSRDEARRERIAAAIGAGLEDRSYLDAPGFRAALGERLRRDLIEDEMIYLEGGEEALPGLLDEVLRRMKAGPFLETETVALLFAGAEAEERETALAERKEDGNSGFDRAAAKVYRALREIQDERTRGALLAAVEAATADASDVWKERVRGDRARRILRALTDDTAFLAASQIADLSVAPQRKAEMDVAISGYPMLWNGMNASVQANQIKSVGISVVLILVLLAILFRSVLVGLAAMAPTCFTLLLSFGVLGFTGVPLDMGSTMITSIALGVGTDYSIHFAWTYRRLLGRGRWAAGLGALAIGGPSIVVNAFEVGLAFGILAFGTVAPVSRFGLLTGETMMLAALATLFLMPLLLWVLRVKQGEELVVPDEVLGAVAAPEGTGVEPALS